MKSYLASTFVFGFFLLSIPLTTFAAFSRPLTLGSRGPDVKTLQIFLNQDPQTRVATTGLGSPFHETTYYGPATKRAVIKFQEKYHSDILTPNHLTKGTGYVGLSTLKKLNALTTLTVTPNSTPNPKVSPVSPPTFSSTTATPSTAGTANTNNNNPNLNVNTPNTQTFHSTPTPPITPSQPVSTPSASQTCSAISQYGITWTFDKSYTCGQFVNGDWWVVGPVTITNINPGHTVVNGRSMNGSMLNPSPINGIIQGYDSMMYPDTGGHHYDWTLNKSYEVATNGQTTITTGSLVSTISWGSLGPINTGADKYVLASDAVLTVVTTPPPTDAFRPSYSGTDKASYYRESQIDYNKLADLVPVSGAPTFDALHAILKYPFIDHVPDWMGADYVHIRNGLQGYGRECASTLGEAQLLVNSNYTNAQKRTVLLDLIQIGIDSYGVLNNGGYHNWRGAGGEYSGRFFAMLFAGQMLGVPDMYGLGTSAESYKKDGTGFYAQETDQTFVVSAADVATVHHTEGWPPNGQGNPPYQDEGGRVYVDYTSSDIGLPEWGIEHLTKPIYDNKSWGAGYRVCCTANAWVGEALVSYAMGIKNLWRHDVFFDYMDRFMATQVGTGWLRSYSDWTGRMWDIYRPTFYSSTQTPKSTVTNSTPTPSTISGQTPTLTEGLVAYYPFDGSTANTNGNGNNGTSVENPLYVDGKIGQALQLNGSNYVSLGSGPNPTGNAITVAAWVKSTTGFTNATVITRGLVVNSADMGDYGLYFDVNGNLNFVVSNISYVAGVAITTDNGAGWGNPTMTFANNTWYHVVGIYDGAHVSLYVNGIQNGFIASFTGNLNVNPTYNGGKSAIGANWYFPDRFFNGSLDDVRIYNRALSASEVQQLYNQ